MKTLPALGIAFIVLRLCEVIAWSWWWVLAPFWVPQAFYVGVIIVGLLLFNRDERRTWIERTLAKFR